MTDEQVSRELVKVAKSLVGDGRQRKADDYTELDAEYQEIVERVVPRYRGKYRNGVATFPFFGTKVSLGTNETKFSFNVSDEYWGSTWLSKDADEILSGLRELLVKLD